MLTSETRFETPNASKYLQQLCKHFGHRVEETHTETEGDNSKRDEHGHNLSSERILQRSPWPFSCV